MPRISAQELERRMQLVFLRVKSSADGITEKEIETATGIDRRTVNNYLNQMVDDGKVYKEGRLWFLGEYEEIRSLKLEITPEEAYTYYLGSRLFVKQHDKRNQLAEAALMKLADALAANKLIEQEIAQAAHELAQRPDDSNYELIFKTVVQCYLQRKPIKIRYKPLSRNEFETTFHTYLIEPSAIGYSTYLIGHSSLPDKMRAYKLERIQSAEPDGERYRIPRDFPGLEILRNSWSIIIGDKTQRIVLRFSPRVKERVLETRWHPSQGDNRDECKQNDDPLLWWADITDTTDMMPWIRSWGSDVSIIAPEHLRRKMTKEIRKLIALYDVVEIPPIPLVQQLWAKTSKDRTLTHPLVCHLMDVAQVAHTLWQQVLTDSSRAHFAAALGLNTDDAGRTIAFWIGLHDLGKACPGFQCLYTPAINQLTAAGLTFPKVLVKERCYHATVTTCTLDELLLTETSIHRRVARKIGQALGGHHGTWPPATQVDGVKQSQLGHQDWDQVRREMVCMLRDLLKPASVTDICESSNDSPEEENSFLILFSGLTTVADWIGSMEEYFPYVDAPLEPTTYFEQAGKQAIHALEQLNWTKWSPPKRTLPFKKLFPFSPNTVQQEAIRLAPKLGESALVIVEVTTGAGKTETALYLADHQAATHQQRGMYIAMPTMATSNQMFDRATEFLEKRYASDAAIPLLIHSQARWMSQTPSPDMNVDENESGASIRDMSWFLPRKRSLLSPFAVGTVDQSLLSVLQTRHFFVRLFALSHKTIIFDEVHAYDVYMSELFEMLLRWLRMVGATVILLSATLPAETRRRLLKAYSGVDNPDVLQAPYPSITWSSNGDSGVIPLKSTEARPPIALHWLNREPQTVCDVLAQQLSAGGCAAVICNTIARAQEIYSILEEANLVPEDDLILFHARNPSAWRNKIEKEVLARFGKDGEETGKRPCKSIVVATQVIEQSLDLDFDIMISDLAPVDLLLQRAGRLHRHERGNRPEHLSHPAFYVSVDQSNLSHPEFGNDKYVYAEYILIRSYLTLSGRDKLLIPQETAELIESVYDDKQLDKNHIPKELLVVLGAAREKMEKEKKEAINEAKKRLILEPDDELLLYQRSPGLEEDSPELHAAFQALTRLGDRSISIVCLHECADGFNTEPDGGGTTIELTQKPNHNQTRILAQYTISLSNKSIVYHLLEHGERPPAWAEHPLLRDHFVLKFKDGIAELPEIKTTLRLGRTYGLEILKEDQ